MVTVKDTDKGAKALMKRLAATIPSGRVGVYGDLAAQKHKDSPRATVGEIAAAHEFGAGVPLRSWMRAPIKAHEDVIAKGLIQVGAAMFRGGNPEQMMRQLVLRAAGWCKEAITAGISPPLNAKYLARKLAKYPGATTPLIASSQFLGSIAGEVEK